MVENKNMKLGVNQLALLRRCYLKKSIGIQDVALYYGIRANHRNKDRLYSILEKLEIMGFFVQSNPHHWILTDFGKDFVEKEFNFKKKERGQLK